MGSVTVFVYFDGVWDEFSNFTGYTVFGLIVSLDSSFESLIGLIAQRIDKEPEKHSYIMHYQTKLQRNMVRISDDYSLNFYLELKRGELDKDIYPLCVELTELESLSADARIAGQTDTDIDALHSLALVQPDPVLGDHFSMDFIDNNPTVEEMGNELADYIKVPADDEVEDSNMVITRPKTNEVAVGKVFRNKELLITTISLFAIKKRFQFVVKKSDTKTYTVKCAEECCDWKLRASVSGVFGNFKIRKMDQVHKCSVGTVLGIHRQASTLVIANCIKYMFLSSRRIYKPRDIMQDIQETYGITISYDKAWRSRERAIEMIRGNKDDSYGNLPSYMHMIENANPGSYTRIETDDENRFLFSFVALGASIAGWMHCKPVIVVDGTFLTNKYGGTLFTACTQDANNNIFILAFGVGDGENNNAWEWVLLRVREAFGNRDELCIVSDRHRSIANAVEKVFPDALHGVCTFHLLQNIKKEYGKKVKGIRLPFNAVARAYTKPEFDTQMRRIDAINEHVRGYLEGVGYEKWSRAHMTTNRYSTMTSNIVESVNSAIKHSKNFPIEALFECLRSTIHKWFFHNLSDAMSTFTHLSTRYNAMLNEKVKLSKHMQVHPSSDVLYQVNDGITPYVVNMDERTCSCRMFQLDHLPCPHAIAVISYRSYSLADYCSSYFTKDKYIEAYQGTIYALGNKDEWYIPEAIKQRLVLPPEPKRGSGRPKEARYKSSLEYKKTSRCRRCDSYGHNSRTCSNPEPLKERCNKKRKKGGCCA